VSLQQPYFLSAWVAKDDVQQQLFAQAKHDSDHYVLGVIGPKKMLRIGETLASQAVLYIGPEIEKNLKGLAPGLDLTIDYGWLWLLSEALFWLLVQAERFLGNWGWSIVAVTCLIKLVFLPLNNKTYQSMRKMQALGPKIDALKARHGADRQALAQATMALYQKEKINPLGGCLPMVVQIPFFFALYWVLIESVQLRHAPFMFWIQDLSAKDPYYVLPVLMGLSMWGQQQLSPSSASPEQAKIMMVLPVVFTFVFLNFPVGLVIYWLTNNLLTILQQWWVMRRAS
jgi:YidC/Oxa1 family membrane protein insertase